MGQGIPEEWVTRVFKKLAQAEVRQLQKAVGSGLGLTFCGYAVEAQGGQIWMNRVIDKGTTVTFTLQKSA